MERDAGAGADLLVLLMLVEHTLALLDIGLKAKALERADDVLRRDSLL